MAKAPNEEPAAPPPPDDAPQQRNGAAPARRAGAAKSRLASVRDAARPKMNARAMISGPAGAGKTWTMLSMAGVLAPPINDKGERTTLVIDTEKDSALTYADNFMFKHLPWRPPFDPTELTEVLEAVPFDFPQVEVVIIDSFTHFWRGIGGTLNIADGEFRGWKEARPIQERVTDALLMLPCHLLLGVRSKMEYLVTNNGHTITKVGLAPVQDEHLVYEMNVAMDIGMDHSIQVVKSRTPAVPVGRVYPPSMERKAAEDYAEWLAGGIPPASFAQVSDLRGRLDTIADKEARARIKTEFVTVFGMPDSLTAEQVEPANAWVTMMVDALDEPEPPTEPVAASEPEAPAEAPESPQTAAEPAEGESTPEPPADDTGQSGGPESASAPDAAPHEQLVAEQVAALRGLSTADITEALTDAGLPVGGNKDVRLRRLAEHIVGSGSELAPAQPSLGSFEEPVGAGRVAK